MTRTSVTTRPAEGRHRNAGFTLVELLIAIALLALILGIATGGLQIGQRAWEASQANETRGEVEAVARSIREYVSQTFPAVALKGRLPLLVFVGRKDEAFFVALSEGETQRGGLGLFAIGLQGEGHGRRLQVWTKVFRAASAWSTRLEDMVATEVLRDVVSLDFAYFGVSEPNKPPEWRTEWLASDRLPLLVYVRFVVVRGQHKFDVPFTVALRQVGSQSKVPAAIEPLQR